MKRILNYNEIIKRNEQLEKENKQLKDRLIQKFLDENTTENYYNFRIEELEKEIKKLKQKNAYLTILTH